MPTTTDLASRLIPLPAAGRQEILARIPRDRRHVSQLADCFGGSWYLHRGDLTVDGDFDSTLNLVVDGDLTVRGTLTDDAQEALLVVTGDLRCEHVFSRQLMVVLGSLHASGVVYADYNDFAFEVWGEALRARALILDDKSALLPERREVGLEYDSDVREAKGDVEGTFVSDLLRFSDAGGDLLRRVEANGSLRWIDEAGEPLDEEASRAVKVERVVPDDFDALLGAIRSGKPVFASVAPVPGLDPQAWQLDRDLSPDVVAAHASSADPGTRVAAASHPRATPSLLASLARDADARVRAAAAHHPDLPAVAATALARDADANVRQQLAAGPHAVPHLDALIGDEAPEVRRAMGSHPALGDAQRRLLLEDPVRAVKGRALHYLPVTAAWVAELRDSADELLCAWAIQHQDDLRSEAAAAGPPPPSDFRESLLDPRRAVREAALRSGPDVRLLSFLEEHRERFVGDESPLLRGALAYAARDGVTLEALANDVDPDVRRQALANLAVPEALLVAEAARVAAAPAGAWNTYDERYIDHMSAVQELLKHPRLPAAALRTIHRVYPRGWRLEAHRNMPLDVILERAGMLIPSLTFEPGFSAWRGAGAAEGEELGAILVGMLDTEDEYLKGAARLNGAVPIAALLSHARALRDDRYALRDVAQNAQLGALTQAAEDLRQLLLRQEEHEIDCALAGNPDLPARVLHELLDRAPQEARRTLWQVHGSIP